MRLQVYPAGGKSTLLWTQGRIQLSHQKRPHKADTAPVPTLKAKWTTDGRLFKPITLQGKPGQALLDLGAACSFINTPVLTQVPHRYVTLEKSPHGYAELADGSEVLRGYRVLRPKNAM